MTNVWAANYNVSRMNTLRALQQSCGSRACLAAALRPPENAKKNRKENEHVENFVFDIAAALRPCFEASARNPGICRADRCTAAARLM